MLTKCDIYADTFVFKCTNNIWSHYVVLISSSLRYDTSNPFKDGHRRVLSLAWSRAFLKCNMTHNDCRRRKKFVPFLFIPFRTARKRKSEISLFSVLIVLTSTTLAAAKHVSKFVFKTNKRFNTSTEAKHLSFRPIISIQVITT